ncbi:hypothetical protein ACHAPG_004818 [Botrytis cinerea]
MAYRAKEADTTTVYPADAIPAIDADEADVYLADKRAKDEYTAIVYHEKGVLPTERAIKGVLGTSTCVPKYSDPTGSAVTRRTTVMWKIVLL